MTSASTTNRGKYQTRLDYRHKGPLVSAPTGWRLLELDPDQRGAYLYHVVGWQAVQCRQETYDPDTHITVRYGEWEDEDIQPAIYDPSIGGVYTPATAYSRFGRHLVFAPGEQLPDLPAGWTVMLANTGEYQSVIDSAERDAVARSREVIADMLNGNAP